MSKREKYCVSCGEKKEDLGYLLCNDCAARCGAINRMPSEMWDQYFSEEIRKPKKEYYIVMCKEIPREHFMEGVDKHYRFASSGSKNGKIYFKDVFFRIDDKVEHWKHPTGAIKKHHIPTASVMASAASFYERKPYRNQMKIFNNPYDLQRFFGANFCDVEIVECD